MHACVHRFACLHVCARVFMRADVCVVHLAMRTQVCARACAFMFACLCLLPVHSLW